MFKAPNFNWYKRDKAMCDFKNLKIQIQNGNEVCINGSKVTKDESGDVIETRKLHHILIKL